MFSILCITDVTGVDKKLDSCSVSVYPALNPDHETLSLPENMLSQFGVVAKVNKDGVVVSGADLIYNYEQVGFDLIIFLWLHWLFMILYFIVTFACCRSSGKSSTLIVNQLIT